jgi:hypothetical protein
MHATLHGFTDGFFVSFRINHGKVILFAFRKRSRNILGFKAVCQHVLSFLFTFKDSLTKDSLTKSGVFIHRHTKPSFSWSYWHTHISLLWRLCPMYAPLRFLGLG